MANNLTRFDPFNELVRGDAFHSMDDFMKNMRLRTLFGDVDAEPRIKLDVAEEDQKYIVKADIPGVKKDDIDIDINGSQVSISAEVRREQEEKSGQSVVRSERYYGKQYRSFTLAQEIDDAAATAKYEDGVLELTLPKKTKSSAKKVVIN